MTLRSQLVSPEEVPLKQDQTQSFHPGYFESWRIPQVLRVYGKGRSSLYAEIKAGSFPPPFKNGRASCLWDSRDVLAEMASRKAAK
jgi:predicted DNA-binding transcriptional regulator AlpA